MNIIYEPKGKAEEYAKLAVNFYVGCSGCCSYCFNKKGFVSKVLGADKPTLRKCFKNETDAFNVFQKEMQHNIEELRKHGLFFSFTTDPLLTETELLTWYAAGICLQNNIPVTILTKQTAWLNEFQNFETYNPHLLSFGFTLTGMDELEPGCPTNLERIEAMKFIHEKGFKVWCSLEPVIDLNKSYEMFKKSYPYCDQYKIGLLSGKKFNKGEVNHFVNLIRMENIRLNSKKLFFKNSIQKYL